MATETLKSDSIEWQGTSELFLFEGNQWDVDQAKELIRTKRPRKIRTMDISGVSALIGKPPVDGKGTINLGVAVAWNRAASDEIDLKVPVILVPYRDSYLPIDGWHRIAKAVLKGITELPCVIMTRAETKLFKMS